MKTLCAMLLLSAVCLGQNTAPTTKTLRDACKIAAREVPADRWSSGNAAWNTGYCTGVVAMWMDLADGYMVDDPLQVFGVSAGITVRVSEMIAEFITVSEAHPEWDKDSAISTLTIAAVARKWYTAKPYVPKAAAKEPGEKVWKTLPGGIEVKNQ